MSPRVLLCDTSSSWGGVQEWMLTVALGLPSHGWETILAGADSGPIASRGASAGVATLSLPRGSPAGLRAMWRLCRSVESCPDAIVCARGRDLRIASPAAWRHRIPLVWRVGGRPALNFWQRFSKSRMVDHVIVPSQFMRDYFVAGKWDTDMITVIPNGINPRRVPAASDMAAARAALGWESGDFVILFVGNLRRVKRVDLLITAFGAVAARHARAHLVIIGSGPWDQRLRALAPPGSRITFTGYQTDPSAYCEACDVLVLPSREETFGLVLLEAMARGKPVIATCVGAIPEVVGDEAGLLVEPGNPDALADALFRLVDSPSLSHEMGRAGVERVQRFFAASLMCERLAETLNRVTDHKPT